MIGLHSLAGGFHLYDSEMKKAVLLAVMNHPSGVAGEEIAGLCTWDAAGPPAATVIASVPGSSDSETQLPGLSSREDAKGKNNTSYLLQTQTESHLCAKLA